MLNAHLLPLSVRETPEFISTMASKFHRFESSWLQSVGNISKQGVQNTHYWSGRTETATENGVAKPDNVVIAVAIRQRRRRYVQSGDGCFVHLLSQYSHTL